MEHQKLYNAVLILVPMVFVMAFGKPFIALLRRRYLGQAIREEGPQHHKAKTGTPTAGGVLILAGVPVGLIPVYLLGREYLTEEMGLAILALFALGAVGLVDDWFKISKRNNRGLSGYVKLVVQALVGLAAGGYMMANYQVSHVSVFNFFRWELGGFYPVFAMLTVIATSNAVNLTDGLDGLAASTTVLSLLALAIIFNGTLYTDVASVYPDLASICLILMGATLGFFVYNLHPAKLFMGDTGSLALGAALGTLAVLSQMEFWLFLIGGVFALETLSVILQVLSFKTTGRRIFRMSPLHHHFELGGWSETGVVIAFTLLQLALCAVALFLYNK